MTTATNNDDEDDDDDMMTLVVLIMMMTTMMLVMVPLPPSPNAAMNCYFWDTRSQKIGMPPLELYIYFD